MASNRKKNSSTFLHIPRTRIQTSKLARSKETSRKVYSTARRTVLFVITAAMLVVVLAVFSKTFLTPERVIKQKIEDIAADYYENYFYPQLTAVAEMQDINVLTEKMGRYVSSGFAIITLRQLLLYDNERYAEAASVITTYCDENKTSIRIFPEPPFKKTDYRTEYYYSCDF